MKFIQQLKHVKINPRNRFSNRASTGEFVSVLDNTFTKAYKPAAVEKNVYDSWEKNGYFKTKRRERNKFSLVLPPPNVTGTLHLGHALTAAIQDTIVRWQRMEGKDVVWVPGLDHAGIATQTVVERWLKQKKNVSRHDIGREQFLKEVINWKNEKGNVINHQLKRFGASLDWTREIFTMDSRHNNAVVEAIVRLWNSGLIYRKESLVNWSCSLSSTISDIEVDHFEISGPTPLRVPNYEKPVVFGEMTDFAYKIYNSDGEVIVSTTRLETMLGDVAVAVHPQDSRFSHLHNSKLWHPFRNTIIPIICDPMVDMKLGTGAVKITPGHSHVDWELAQRHSLPLISVIDEKGCIAANEDFNIFQGLKRFEAREAIKNKLVDMDLLRSVHSHSMQVPICSRSGDVLEYLLKDQWFISCKEMAKKASEAVKEGKLLIEPMNFQNTWFNWLDNIQDWCISRQLWWGHQLPMYYAVKGGMSTWVAASSLSQAISKASAKFGSEPESVRQDQDVLDTWFSSAIYPLSALGWPDETDDLKLYYPLDIMETGHDIIFFWVARMAMLGTELTDQLPFKKILLHGIICDAQGRKMSKSLGNVINPEDVINGISLEGLKQQVIDSHNAGILSAKEMKLALQGQQKLFPNGIPECGTDALRFTLLSHNTKSHFISFDAKECEKNRHFCNKIWQASRFSLNWSNQFGITSCCAPENPGLMDRWILSQLSKAVTSIVSALHSADFYHVTSALKDFLYENFCDVYVETTKPVLRSGSEEEAINTIHTLLHCLDVSLRLASPIMPFICEQLYLHLPGNQNKSAMLSEYPSSLKDWSNPDLDKTVQFGLDVLSVIRSMKSVNGFFKKFAPVEVETGNENAVLTMKNVIEVLANCSLQVTGRTNEARQQTITDKLGDHTLIHINLQNLNKEQLDEYIKTLLKKETKLQKTLDKMVETTFKNNNYSKLDKESQLKHSEMIRKLEEELRVLRSLISNEEKELS